MGERNRNGKRPAVSEESPGFCLRVQSREDLKDGKKELPPAAVRRYGDKMADHIFLKAPNCGKHWKIELTTSPRRDRMWLQKGWEEFARFYLLDQGDWATFRSEGEHAHFHELMSVDQRGKKQELVLELELELELKLKLEPFQVPPDPLLMNINVIFPK